MSDKPLDHDRPLDALMPELQMGSRASEDAGPAVHPSVLEVELDDGYEWLYAAWGDPGGASALRQAVERLLTVTILWRLSRNPTERDHRNFVGARLMLFEPIEGDVKAALASLGFVEDTYQPERFPGRMMALSQQASRAGWTIPAHPVSMWTASISQPDATLTRNMREIDDAIADTMNDGTWGEDPGRMSKLLADQLRAHFHTEISPDIAGAQVLDVLLVDHRPSQLRWMPPMLFQAICDFVGVALQASFDYEVGWAQATRDSEGMPAPPVLRTTRHGESKIVPVGQHVLRWCVLPQMPGLSDILLSDRIEELARSL